MKIVNLLAILFIFIGTSTWAQSSTNDSLLQHYYKYPQEGIKNAEELYQKAIHTNNQPELVKALIQKAHFSLLANNDNYPLIIEELEKHLNTIKDAVAKSILHSYIGQNYLRYYQTHSWDIRDRKQLQGEIPQNMAEWSSNIFQKKILYHFSSSVSATEELQQTPLSSYKEIILPGSTDSLRPTLYDLLSYRAIRLLQESDYYFPSSPNNQAALLASPDIFINLSIPLKPDNNQSYILQFWQNLLRFHMQSKYPDALLMCNLDRLHYANRISALPQKDSLYLSSLKQMEKTYSSTPMVVEILVAEVQLLLKKQPEPPLPVIQEVLDICEKGIQQYPDYKRINLLHNIIQDLRTPEFSVSIPQFIYPGDSLKINASLKNTKNAQLTLYRLKTDTPSYWNTPDDKKHQIPGTSLFQKNFVFRQELVRQDTLLSIPVSTSGFYKIVITTPEAKHPISDVFVCSQLFSTVQVRNNQCFFHIRDWKSGKPVKNAKVSLYKKNQSLFTACSSCYSNNTGIATLSLPSKQNNFYYEVTDNNNPNGYIFSGYRMFYQENHLNHTTLITDRKIYRPGQTVYFQGISWTETPDSLYPSQNRQTTVAFRDPKGKILSEQKSVTDQFGTFSGHFVIPSQLLNGNFSLTSPQGSTTIIVADYKRPDFSITFETPQRSYYLGDTIQLQGKINSFTDIALTNQEIQYEILPHTPFARFSPSYNKIQGVAQTNTMGEFNLSIPTDKNISSHYAFRILSYQVTIKATDAKGETQERSTYIPVHTGSSVPLLQIPEQLNKQASQPFIIQLEDRSPKEAPVTVYYTISKLKSPAGISMAPFSKDTLIESIISEGQLKIAQKDSIFPDLSHQPSGAYLFSVKNGSAQSKQIFYLYSLRDKKPPIPTYQWIVKEKTECYPGETARILFGTSAREVYLTYEIFTNQKLLKKATTILSNEILPIDIPYRTEYGNQIWVAINYVKDKNYIQEVIPVRRRRDNGTLTIHTSVFRDKLQPGQSEEWQIRILNEQGQPAAAQALAFMYDASLEQFEKNNIYFHPDYLTPEFRFAWQSSYIYNAQKHRSVWGFTQKKYFIPPFQFGELNQYLFNKTSGAELTDYGSEIMVTGKTPAQKNASISMRKTSLDQQTESDNEAETGAGALQPVIEFRENFQETAFFYPQLQTDSFGNINLRFEMPQALTQWKFTVLAYTQELAYNQLVRTITTSQPFIVRPNLPRFFRSGDQTIIKATISNLSETLQEGYAQLELFTPQGQQTLLTRKSTFKIPANSSQTVSFELEVPQNTNLVGCRISAIAPNFSDGEQHLIAILPDKTLLTETLPIYAAKSGTYSYHLKNTSPKQQDYRLTLELTANPVWYAVQALPSLQEPRQENVTDISASYYVNTLTAHIARSNPKIISTIRQWDKTKNTPEQLSPLKRNQELKSILLEATPWMLEAGNETERIHTLIQLFEPNRLQHLQKQALQKLSDLQTQEGGWSWFKGMPASRFMTSNVLTMMARCINIGEQEYGEEEKQMQIKALRYLDNGINKDFSERPKQLGYEQILYLYCRSAYQDIPLGDALEAHKHFMAIAQKKWGSFSLYEKALIAVVFHRYGFSGNARDILKSLRQYAEVTPDSGMFWPNNRNSYYRNSALLKHTAIMEAFYEIDGNTPELDLMKQWLLCQKQVQDWGNVPSTVNAIHALLLTGSNWLNKEESLQLTLGNRPVPTTSATNPLGYLKISYPASEIKPDMLQVKITKEKNTPTWGGLYLQYFEKLSQVKKNQNALSVGKKLFVEKKNDKGAPVILPLQGQTLKIGDKVIVRLTLSLDRDMDYLHLKDLRAGCFEPSNQLSGNHWQFGSVYYQEIKDAVTNFFFHSLARGTYVIEYPVWVSQAGSYQDGIATFQSIYAPEYNAFSNAEKIVVNP